MIDPLALLRRTDKWYLGNGGMLVYAPPFPQHLHMPGFWDDCHFGDLAVPPSLEAKNSRRLLRNDEKLTTPRGAAVSSARA